LFDAATVAKFSRLKNRLPKSLRPFAIVLVAIGVQVPLFWAFASSTEGSGFVSPCAGGRCRPSEPKIQMVQETPPPPKPDDTRVVETPEQLDEPDARPVKTTNVSDKTTRTEDETKAPPGRKVAATNPSPQKPTPQKPTATQNPDATDVPKTDTEVADARQPDRKEAPGPGNPPSVMDKGPKTQILQPPGSRASALANLSSLAGDPGTMDHLPNVNEGAQTVLNSDRHRFADFFLKVKSQVERHWAPSPIYTQRDPTGELYGVKDRYTVLMVRLDPMGTLLGTNTTRASGLDFLDDEAKRAIREAAPFLNPPRGLIGDNGEIRFEFGFYFEITAGRLRTNYKRL